MMLFVGAVVVSFVGMAALGKHFGSIPILNRFALKPPNPDDVVSDRTLATSIGEVANVAVGDEGVADSTLRPAGRAKFGDQYVDVVTDGSFVDEGRRVQIVNINGHRIMVRQVS